MIVVSYKAIIKWVVQHLLSQTLISLRPVAYDCISYWRLRASIQISCVELMMPLSLHVEQYKLWWAIMVNYWSGIVALTAHWSAVKGPSYGYYAGIMAACFHKTQDVSLSLLVQCGFIVGHGILSCVDGQYIYFGQRRRWLQNERCIISGKVHGMQPWE